MKSRTVDPMSDEFDFVMSLKDKSEILCIGSNDMHSKHVVIYSDYEFQDSGAYAIESNDCGQSIAYWFGTVGYAIEWAENVLA